VDTLTSVPALCTQVIAWLERQAVR
jgi:hypothetical protein